MTSKVLISLVVFSALIVAFVLWASGPSLPDDTSLPILAGGAHRGAPADGRLQVATWNIAYGQGYKSKLTDSISLDEQLQNMNAVVAQLRTLNADVVLLQEVDFGADRSHGQDQAQFLADHTDYAAVACAPMWVKRWIPYPGLAPSSHLGEMRTGLCILSRYPLKAHRRRLFPPTDYKGWLASLFYSRRGIQTATVTVGETNIALVNLHLESFDRETRQRQAKTAVQVARETERPIVVAGDINTVPARAGVMTGYTDEPGTNFKGDTTLPTLQALGLHEAVVPGELPEAATRTFPAHAPNRRLDAVFAGRGLAMESSRVAREVGTVSDHLPIVAALRIEERAD